MFMIKLNKAEQITVIPGNLNIQCGKNRDGIVV